MNIDRAGQNRPIEDSDGGGILAGVEDAVTNQRGLTNGDRASDGGQMDGGDRTETGEEHQGIILGILKRARGQKGGKQSKISGHLRKISRMKRGDELG